MVDHVLRVRRGKAGPPTLPPCNTLDHATHGPALQPLATDHCPVIFFCGLHTRSAAGKRTSRVTWRLELLHQQQERDAYQLAVRARAHTALGLQATEPGDQHGVDRMASAVVDMLTGSALSALGRRTIVMGISKSWFTPAVQSAARRRRASMRLMLCRPYDAAARGDVAVTNREFPAAVRAARRAQRDQLERTCARHCHMSPGSYVMHKSLERLAAAPRGQGIPSLRHPETGASCTTDEAKATALAAFRAAISREREPATQEESSSVARAHAALAAEWARPGHDAHGQGDDFTFDEVRGCMTSHTKPQSSGGLWDPGGTAQALGWHGSASADAPILCRPFEPMRALHVV